MKKPLFYFFLMLIVLPLSTKASDDEKDKDHEEKNKTHHGHHNFELEVSYNDALHFEFTGSVYFMPQTKIQATVEDTGNHFAAVLVRELPFRNSKFGTFFGAGCTFGFSEHSVHEGGSPHDTHGIASSHTSDVEKSWHKSFIVQSGLAYSLSNHWSTGFTLSPGYNFDEHRVDFGATIDLVFAF